MSESWKGFISRLSGDAQEKLRNNSDGVCATTVHVLLNSDGEPILWTEPVTRRIEPSRAVLEIVRRMSDS